MRRRSFLHSIVAALGIGTTSNHVYAAESGLDCGIWYDAEITAVTDGDTVDVLVYENDTQYNVRVLGNDTPEKTGNTYYEKVEEWEFIDDETHLEEWGNKAMKFAESELPVGTQCQVKLDCESEELDQYGRLLAKIRYDRSGDGIYGTVYNKFAIEEGYARVYAASMTNTDEYLGAQRVARKNGRGLWVGEQDSLSEWRNRDVSMSFHPHTSSIVTTDGKVPPARVPVWAEPEAIQENTSSSTVAYDDGNLPLVGVDRSTNVAYFGGVTVNEAWEDNTTDLDHFTFVTNLIDELHGDAIPSGPVLVDGGHKTFNQDNAVSAEDMAFYQRYLEGIDIELHSINDYSNDRGYALSEARALVASSCPDEWTQSEIDAVQQFLDNGGVVLLMGSGSETAGERANLDDLAAGIGTDLRLNIDDVRDDTNNANDDRRLLVTENLNREDFDLWTAYDGESSTTSGILDASPDDANASSTHTWTLEDASNDFDREVDFIDVDYPPGTSLDGLTNEDVTVFLDRDGDGMTDEIPINSDEYSGSSATFDLDGRYNTSVEGELTVRIDRVENPDAGDYVATETLNGDDTYPVKADLSITGITVTTDSAEDVTDSSATLTGTLTDMGGADEADVSFEWGASSELSNTTTAQTLSSTGSFSASIGGLAADTTYEFRAIADGSNGTSGTGGIESFTTSPNARSDVLDVDPNNAGSESSHTWTLSDPSNDFDDEVDAIDVDYPLDTSLDGLTNDDVTVYLDRDGDGSTDEIPVNFDEYGGASTTFDLDGRYNTSVEGEIRVLIDGVTNPTAGEYVATETLNGDDTLAIDAEFIVE